MSDYAPPLWLSRALGAMLPRSRSDEILGDLHEEFSAVAERRGHPAAILWYAAQGTVIAASTVLRRSSHLRSGPAPAPAHGDPLMRTLAADIRYAARGLRKAPAISALVVLTLALGLAANAAIFQVIDALLLRPFTFPDVDRIALVAETAPDQHLDMQESFSPANYLDLKAQADVFERIAAFEWWDGNFASEEGAERISGFLVTAEFFDVMGVHPAAGRAFTAEEEVRGNHRRVILAHGLWMRRFAGDTSIVGRPVLLNGEPFEVVGIMPEGFEFPLGAQIWGPLAMGDETRARRDSRYLTVLGRLADGRTLDDARGQVALIGARLAQQYPEANKGRGAQAVTLVRGFRDAGLGPIAGLWQASAVFVLLIGCANIANLLLARGAERQREIAVRTALGASRLRIARELLIESLLLALAAVPVALALAWVGIELIRANLPPRLVRFVAGWQSMDVDGRLILFTAILAAVATMLFGLLPALRSSQAVPAQSLKDGGRGATAGRERQRARRALVVGQIALALPLLVASGVSALGANRFLNGSQGYNPDGLLSMRVVLPEATYPDSEARRRFVDEATRRLLELPGVRGVTVANVLPSLTSNPMRAIEIEGQPNPDPANPPTADYRAVSPSYFDVLQQPVIRGRRFTQADHENASPVVIVSSAFAAKFFPDTDPIGRRLRFGDGPWQTVVGISGDVIHNWFAGRNQPTVYRPFAQAASMYLAIGVRADGDPAALTLPAQEAIRSVDRTQAAYEVMPMTTVLHERTIGLQYVAGIMSVFGTLALVLAVVGVYSVMAFMVTQRTHEIGVRIALGATRQDVLRLTVGNTARLTMIGVLLGLAGSLALSRVLESLLVGVLAADHRVSFGVAAVLTASALLAGYVPARRATSIDPIVALRE